MFRLLLWSILSGVALAGALKAHREGVWTAANHWFQAWLTGGDGYSPVRFEVDLVDRANHVRLAGHRPLLRLDTGLEAWLAERFPEMPLSDVGEVTRVLQDAHPRYMRISVCTASAPTLRLLLDQFHDFCQGTAEEMTHLACAVRPSGGGLGHQALMVVGQRLLDFDPDIIATTADEAFFSTCPHCKHPHIVRISRQQHSLGLECPGCRRTYAVVASDEEGRYRYVNEFLTGYAPPAVFSKDQSRVHELFTIWSAVHAGCIYTRDASSPDSKDVTDSWQTSLQTQRLGKGDCEDSAIYLCDWLLSRGFQARVALGRYGDMGGHAWVVVKLDDREYLLESTEGRPDPSNPPLVSRIGSRYVPEVMFDRFALYVRAVPGQAWKGDYWSGKAWLRVEPRPLQARIRQHDERSATATAAPERLARTSRPNPAVAPFMELEEIPPDALIWEKSLDYSKGNANLPGRE